MSNIKKLAGQTVWYGGSSIIARMLNYLLTPYLTYNIATSTYGNIQLLYALIPFFNVLFTYGMETAFFRFASKEGNGRDVYNTSLSSILFSTLLFTTILLLFREQLADIISLQLHPELITYAVLIIGLDTLTTLPFALLRYNGRPVKYATVRLVNIIITLALTYFFISLLPQLAKAKSGGFFASIYKPGYEVGYVIIANLIASFVQLLLLFGEFLSFRIKVNKKLWTEMMIYSLPMILVGMGGMVNEVADRLMLNWWAPGTAEARKSLVGIYSANYKLSILITLFIQAFRLGAEPFFFKQAEGINPQRTYARVMKFFVIVITLMFLLVVVFLDVWKYFVGADYRQALGVVPILLLANMFLGIYYNLSVWYKVTNKTMAGAWITIAGALVTIIINYFFIPAYGYYASAWATFLAYGLMMILSYTWGQKDYPIPYPVKNLLAYLLIVVAIFMIHKGISLYIGNEFYSIVIGLIFISLYVLFLSVVEQKELAKLPFVGKFFNSNKTVG